MSAISELPGTWRVPSWPGRARCPHALRQGSVADTWDSTSGKLPPQSTHAIGTNTLLTNDSEEDVVNMKMSAIFLQLFTVYILQYLCALSVLLVREVGYVRLV